MAELASPSRERGGIAHLNATAKPTLVASSTESPVPVQNLKLTPRGNGGLGVAVLLGPFNAAA